MADTSTELAAFTVARELCRIAKEEKVCKVQISYWMLSECHSTVEILLSGAYMESLTEALCEEVFSRVVFLDWQGKELGRVKFVYENGVDALVDWIVCDWTDRVCNRLNQWIEWA